MNIRTKPLPTESIAFAKPVCNCLISLNFVSRLHKCLRSHKVLWFGHNLLRPWLLVSLPLGVWPRAIGLPRWHGKSSLSDSRTWYRQTSPHAWARTMGRKAKFQVDVWYMQPGSRAKRNPGIRSWRSKSTARPYFGEHTNTIVRWKDWHGQYWLKCSMPF